MKVRIVLQSRSKSNRLPFKSLTNINGYPLAVLCAKRLENTGREVIIATSDSQEDDRLVKIIKDNKIKYIRGSLSNVFQRYLLATKDLKNNDILIRATADNVFVDGFLIDELVAIFRKTKKEYLNFSKKHNTPYGFGAEIMKVGVLRKLSKLNLNNEDKEHVTLKLKKKYGEHSLALIKKFTLRKNYNHLRMTIDTIDDYIIISNFFKSIENPIDCKSSILLKQFIKNHSNLKKLLVKKKRMKKLLILGGGQDQLGTINLARKNGLYIIIFDKNLNAIGRKFCDHFIYISNKDINNLLFFTKKIKIEGTIVQGPDIPYVSSKIEENLKIKNIPLKSAFISTNKYKMKKKFMSKGIPVPKFCKYKIGSRKKINLRYPIIIKPFDKSGSRGVIKCDNYNDFLKYKKLTFLQTSKKEILIEEFLKGPQISTETLVYKGKIFTPGFVDRNYDMIKKFKPRIIENGGSYPSEYHKKYYEKINVLIKKISKSLNIYNGTIKGDIVIHKNKPYVIEVALRLSGGDLSETLIPLSTNFNLIKCAIFLSLRKKIPKNKLKFKFKNIFIGHRYFFPKKGVIKSISGINKIKKYKWLKKIALFYSIGDRVKSPQDHTNRLGVFIVVGRNKKEIDKRIKIIYKTIKFTISR